METIEVNQELQTKNSKSLSGADASRAEFAISYAAMAKVYGKKTAIEDIAFFCKLAEEDVSAGKFSWAEFLTAFKSVLRTKTNFMPVYADIYQAALEASKPFHDLEAEANALYHEIASGNPRKMGHLAYTFAWRYGLRDVIYSDNSSYQIDKNKEKVLRLYKAYLAGEIELDHNSVAKEGSE